MRNNREAILSPQVQELLDRGNIDVIIVKPQFGNEAGYYVGHKLNATLVFFTTFPYSQPELNWAVGDSHNPAFTPHMMLGLSQNMNFKERLINTAFRESFELLILIFQNHILLLLLTLKPSLSAFYLLMRKFYTLPKVEQMLSEVFPEDSIPSLDELKQSAGWSTVPGLIQ